MKRWLTPNEMWSLSNWLVGEAKSGHLDGLSEKAIAKFAGSAMGREITPSHIRRARRATGAKWRMARNVGGPSKKGARPSHSDVEIARALTTIFTRLNMTAPKALVEIASGVRPESEK